jgi:phospholipase/carboxylesterase
VRARPRLLLALLAALLAGTTAAALVSYRRSRPDVPIGRHHQEGRLAARPRPPTQAAPGPGLVALGTTRRRGDALLYVPGQVAPDRPAGLVLWLHGHGGRAESSMKRIIPDADRLGVLVVAPTSRGPTWDVVWRKSKRFGPDVSFVDATLTYVFERFTIDPRRIIVAGYSDGGTYALALGLGNGDLFSRVVAMAPEYIPPAALRMGKPPVFIAHGLTDDQHPIDQTSRQIAPRLRAAGHAVTYEEYQGGHALPPAVLARALEGM